MTQRRKARRASPPRTRSRVSGRTSTKGPGARKRAAVAKPGARRRAATPRPRLAPDAAPAAGALRLAGVGSEAVLRATGKAWEEWLAVLDRAGALAMPHRMIAQTLRGKFGIPDWWSQMLAVGYEQARGLRAPHQKADGFAASASRTINAALERVWAAWTDPKLRALWLPGAPIEVRRANDGKSMRITWTLGPSSVEVNFRADGPRKSRVQVEHGKLGDEESVIAQKAYWSEGLDRLKSWLEAGR